MAWELVLNGIDFGEGPRWRDGRFWFCDFYQHSISSVGGDGMRTVEHADVGRPSGLGWLPDGRLLFVEMETRTVMRVEADGSIAAHANLSDIATGTATTWSWMHWATPTSATSASTWRQQQTSPRPRSHSYGRTARWKSPQLISWFSDALGKQVVRVVEGGEITHRLPTDDNTSACMLGGADGDQLFALTCLDAHPSAASGTGTGRLWVTTVDVARNATDLP